MSYTMADFRREMSVELLCQLSDEDFQRYLRLAEPPATRPVVERLKSVLLEARLEGLSADEIMTLLPEDVIHAVCRPLLRSLRDSHRGRSGEQMD
jgi:hypothetical protein